jgi:hypothetical protein
MAITNHERVGKALDLLRGGFGPLVVPPAPATHCARCSTTTAPASSWFDNQAFERE